MQESITIPLEEYKELLIIKGKYEELKSQQNIYYTPNITPLLRKDGSETIPRDMKITC